MDYYAKSDEIILNQLGKSRVPSNENYMRIIGKIVRKYKDLAPVVCFNYGVRVGKHSERDLEKWNALCAYDWADSYVKEYHGFHLPKYKKFRKWCNDRNSKKQAPIGQGKSSTYNLIENIRDLLWEMSDEHIKAIHNMLVGPDETFIPEDDYEVIKAMGMPKNEKTAQILGRINQEYSNNCTVQTILAFNYGMMLGSRDL